LIARSRPAVHFAVAPWLGAPGIAEVRHLRPGVVQAGLLPVPPLWPRPPLLRDPLCRRGAALVAARGRRPLPGQPRGPPRPRGPAAPISGAPPRES